MSIFARILLYAAAGLGLLVLAVGAGAGLYIYFLSQQLPDYQALQSYEPPITTRVHAGDGSLVAEFAVERRIFVPIADIPPRVMQAFISAEDKNFYTHRGVDVFGVFRAAVDNIYNYVEGRRPEGASTITQQVAKNFLLTNEVSVDRKIKEALLSFRIEDAYTKDKILELYLNQIYLGSGYGVAAAAQNYFNKALDELSIEEAAYLAALPKAPSNYHPIRNRDKAIERRNWVIDEMLDNGYITVDEANSAKKAQLTVTMRPMGAQTAEAEYFAEEVRRIVMEKYGEQSLYAGGLVVRSTLDPRLQRIAIAAFRKGLVKYDREHGFRGPVAKIELDDWAKRLAAQTPLLDVTEWRLGVVLDFEEDKSTKIGLSDGKTGKIPFEEIKWARKFLTDKSRGPEITKPTDVFAAGDVVYVQKLESGDYSLQQVPGIQGGFVALDPHTGRVLAAVGGFSYYGSEFNRATQALRQTGSAFKPIVYAAALDSGYTPSSIVIDGPFAIEQGPGLPLWRPENYTDDFLGPTTLRVGLSLSRNLMTVRMAHAIGMETVATYAEKLGVTDHMERMLAMSLGSKDTTVLRLVSAYAVFVNGGKRVEPTFIDRIQDRHGKTIYRHDQRECPDCMQTEWHDQPEPILATPGTDVLDSRTAYQMVSLLEGVVQYGTGTAVKVVGFPVAGKTGTTNDEKDAWFIGFTPDLVMGTYLGFDQPRPMGRGQTGGANAAPIVRDFLLAAFKDKPAVPFRVPPGIELVRVNRKTGQYTDATDGYAILEAFKSGTGPGTGINLTEGEYAAAEQGPWSPTTPTNATVSEGTGGLY
jgi:penicillin-binding protein 1A